MSTFEVGDEVRLSDFGVDNNQTEYEGMGTICGYRDGADYPYRVVWEDAQEEERYSSSELMYYDGDETPQVPALKGYALWISKQEVTR